MQKRQPKISIVIPTKNSGWILPICLEGIRKQKYPKGRIEVIVADNDSNDNTIDLAKRFGAKVVNVSGKPPLVCQQRNLGAQNATGEWLIFLDHDMEISPDLLDDFVIQARKNTSVDAWFIPERIITGSNFLTAVRNFERQFYNATPIDAVRIIRKTIFFKTSSQYDPLLSNGPADWDLDIQLRHIGCRFGSINKPLFHHEERMDFLRYILKKGTWAGGIEAYKKKWSEKYRGKYKNIIDQQFGIKYRGTIVFFEKGKWKKVIQRPDLYLWVLRIKLVMLLLTFAKPKHK